MAGNSKRKGAIRKSGTKKGQTVGSGGQRRRGLEARGATPKAEDRVYHKAYKAKQAAQRREHAFPVHQRGRVDLPEEFERHPPKEHDIGEYKILSQIQGREAVQQAPDDEQAAEEDQQGREVSLPPDIEEGDPRDELDRQVDGLRDAVVDVFGEENVDDDRAQE